MIDDAFNGSRLPLRFLHGSIENTGSDLSSDGYIAVSRRQDPRRSNHASSAATE
jgi:hypothetical protein